MIFLCLLFRNNLGQEANGEKRSSRERAKKGSPFAALPDPCSPRARSGSTAACKESASKASAAPEEESSTVGVGIEGSPRVSLSPGLVAGGQSESRVTCGGSSEAGAGDGVEAMHTPELSTKPSGRESASGRRVAGEPSILVGKIGSVAPKEHRFQKTMADQD